MTEPSMPMPLETVETLRQVNHNLRSALFRLRPECQHCSSIKPQDFSNILSQLLRAGQCLRGLPPHSEKPVALEKEALEYRNHLEKLKHFLPDVQVRLLAEKSRLEIARTHVATAAAWAQSRKKAL
jgi:hypothetical protein